MDQPAVSCAVLASRGINTRNPQASQIPAARAPISIGIPQAFQHSLVRSAEQARTGSKLAFGKLKDFFVVLAPTGASLYSWHFSLSCEPLGVDGFRSIRCIHPTAAIVWLDV
jgi:hypothetical protein